MTSLIDAVGECLVRLGDGNYDGSLAVIDGYLGHTSATSDSEPEPRPEPESELGQHPHGVSIERRTALLSDDNYSESSSFSDVASFRDASSSPFWPDARFPFRSDDDERKSDVGPTRQHTVESVLGSLRQLVQREREWVREKNVYETYLEQMALQLQQQSQVLPASAEPAVAPAEVVAATGASPSTTAPKPAADDTKRSDESQPATSEGKSELALPATSNWWSIFLPVSAAAETSRDIASGTPSWSPVAMPASMAPSTLPFGASRFPTITPAGAVVSATGKDACLECIQACEHVAESVLNGDFSARVRCSRCHAATDDDDPEWPMLPKSGAGASHGVQSNFASTPLISRPLSHTQRLANRVNRMASLLSCIAGAIVDVARNEGVRGNLGTQGNVDGLKGTWFDLMSELNTMATIHSEQIRDIADVCTSMVNGDFTKRVTVEADGEMLNLKTTINDLDTILDGVTAGVTRVAIESGAEGQLGIQASVGSLKGTWRDMTYHLNSMSNNLTSQVREISGIMSTVARGDFTKKVTAELKGEWGFLKSSINTMVDQLNTITYEVSRVARQVGTEGNLGGQAYVDGVDGTWKDLTDNVNSMAANLTSQVRDIAEVTTAVAKGDLTRKVEVELSGEMGLLKTTINTMVDQLGLFASEVSRVAREVGTDGKLGGKAEVVGVDGTWKDLTDNVNKMADNLTNQVRDIADVTTAVAKGDLTRKVQVELSGEMGQLKTTINTMVDQLGLFASEVSRVAREVGTEGNLGGQAEV
ncbi:hypothetical protein GGH94_002893, partial [Coemansia aciculifera]